jgi:cytochrome c-type biogenesis protein
MAAINYIMEGMTYFYMYFAGFLSFFSPCILPIIPVYFSILSGTGKLIYKALLFCFGFSLIFALMGGGAGILGTFIQANRASVNIVAGFIIMLLGLKFLNLIQIPMLDRSYSISGERFRTRFEFLNAFIIGLLFAVTWSPCIGAILGGILTYISASGKGAVDGAIKLFLYGVGISTPLIVSVFFYTKLQNFYRNSPYFFDMVKKLLGFILLIFAFSLLYHVVTISKNSQKQLGAIDKVMLPEKLPLFVSFNSATCEDCKTMEPVIAKLKSSCGGKVVDFRTVDMDDSQYEYLSYQEGIFGSPTYILVDSSGKEKQRLFGVLALEELDKNIKILTGNSCLY